MIVVIPGEGTRGDQLGKPTRWGKLAHPDLAATSCLSWGRPVKACERKARELEDAKALVGGL